MVKGQKHLVDCHCILPIYKGKKPTIYHKFAVYSKIDPKSGNIIPKYVNCNNCGVTHLVYELCKSEIKIGKEDVGSARSIEEVCLSIPDKIVSFLKKYQPTIDVYEEVEDVLENNYFPSDVVIKREIIDENYNLKIMKIKNLESVKVFTEILDTTLIKEEQIS